MLCLFRNRHFLRVCNLETTRNYKGNGYFSFSRSFQISWYRALQIDPRDRVEEITFRQAYSYILHMIRSILIKVCLF